MMVFYVGVKILVILDVGLFGFSLTLALHYRLIHFKELITVMFDRVFRCELFTHTHTPKPKPNYDGILGITFRTG